MSVRAAIVGCGRFADMHVEEMAKLTNGRLVAVCDAEPLMAEQLAQRYSVPSHFSNLDEMLDKVRPDVLHIITPPQSHLDLAEKGMRAGCHVFVEKPIALNYSDTRKLIALSDRYGKKLTTGWRINFDPPALLLRKLVAEGTLGDPVHLESFYGYDLSGPFGPALLASKDHWVRKLPGQLFHNNIDHLLNKFPPFFGDHTPAVTAQQSCFRPGIDLPDELRVMLAGKRVTGFARFSANIKPVAHTFTVFGTKETANIDYVARTVTFAAGPKLPSAVGRLLTAFGQAAQFSREGMRNVVRFLKSDYHFNSGLGLLIQQFYDSILKDTAPPIPYREMLWVYEVMDQIFQQTAEPVGRESVAC